MRGKKKEGFEGSRKQEKSTTIYSYYLWRRECMKDEKSAERCDKSLGRAEKENIIFLLLFVLIFWILDSLYIYSFQ